MPRGVPTTNTSRIMLYVICTDRQGAEMGPRGIVLHKLVIECSDSAQAVLAKSELEKRSQRFNAIQTTPNLPVFNPAVYTSNKIAAPAFLQGR